MTVILAHTLSKKADLLARQIYASLPKRVRVANLFVKLGFTYQETFGRFIMARFIAAGVQGLPDIDGKPALALQAQMSHPRAEMKLPRGYGLEFGKKAYAWLLKKSGQVHIAEEVLSVFITKMVGKKVRIKEGVDLDSALAYVYSGLRSTLSDVFRTQQGRDKQKNIYMDVPSLSEEDGPSNSLDSLPSQSGAARIEDMFENVELTALVSEIEDKLGNKAADWLEKKVDGWSQREIAQSWGVHETAVSLWQTKHLDAIKAIAVKHLKNAA